MAASVNATCAIRSRKGACQSPRPSARAPAALAKAHTRPLARAPLARSAARSRACARKRAGPRHRAAAQHRRRRRAAEDDGREAVSGAVDRGGAIGVERGEEELEVAREQVLDPREQHATRRPARGTAVGG